MLEKNLENIQKKLLKWFLAESVARYQVMIEDNPIMKIILDPEEYREYSKTKTSKQREKFIRVRGEICDG